MQSANLDLFDVDQTTNELVPIPPVEQFTGLEFGLFTRCPGGATQPVPGSNPFTDNGGAAVRRPAAESTVPPERRATGPMRRIVLIFCLLLARAGRGARRGLGVGR